MILDPSGVILVSHNTDYDIPKSVRNSRILQRSLTKECNILGYDAVYVPTFRWTVLFLPSREPRPVTFISIGQQRWQHGSTTWTIADI
jgi:hypothetical protein